MNQLRRTLLLASGLWMGIVIYSIALASETKSGTDEYCGFSAEVQFNESAPKDRFTIKNTSSSHWHLTKLTLDLGSSAGNLVFDVTAKGAGVEVFQPFKSEQNEAILKSLPVVKDGDQMVVLEFSGFTSGTHYQFSIDVDDQLVDSKLGQIRIAGSEIEGALLTLTVNNNTGQSTMFSGAFNSQSLISLTSDDC